MGNEIASTELLTMDKTIMASDIAIRKATLEDIDQLLSICRCSFPDSLRWLSKTLGQRWWKEHLMGNASMTWVAEDSGGVIAFCVLVIDEAVWSRRRKFWSTSTLNLVGSVLLHPITASLKVIQKLRACIERAQPVIHMQGTSWFSSELRTWMELIAVDPGNRKKGVAAMLLKRCEQTTKDLGRKAVALRVASQNIPAKCFYESHGFVLGRSDADGYLYMKCID